MAALKIVSLVSWCGLLLAQLSLLRPSSEIEPYWILLATIPLLIPLPGLWRDKLYTYRWVGFLMLIYLCVGISEWVASPALGFYGLATAGCSIALFLASIYHARNLRLQQNQS